MGSLLLKTIPLFIFLMLTPVYGESEAEILKTPFEKFIDYAIDSITMNFAGTNSTQDQDTAKILDDTGEGIKKTFDMWVWLHEHLVNLILYFAGWFGVSFDKTIALLISFFIGTLLLGLGFYHFGKRFWKIAVVILIAIIIIALLPIDNLKL